MPEYTYDQLRIKYEESVIKQGELITANIAKSNRLIAALEQYIELSKKYAKLATMYTELRMKVHKFCEDEEKYSV